ncbi:MAG: class I SAM-dependent methyltransferase [Burkholderiales bacterium]|nr:class I SAM-dependent methyltransferase [Burkholderiales bacterium]
MAALEFTGERFVPGVAGEIAHEHWHRYAFARRFAGGQRVLDVACGEGYGSALLAAVSRSVIGVDIADAAVAHARAAYAGTPNLRFETGSAAALPLPAASVDLAVSFETLEHLPRELQPRMLADIGRVLTDEGVLVLSVPNPAEYSLARGYCNPFHEHEPPRDELAALLATHFPAQRWYRQRRYLGSAIWSEDAAEACEAWVDGNGTVDRAPPPAAMYHVVVAAKRAEVLPPPAPMLSLFSDREESELARLDAQAAELLRLDGLLAERDGALDKSAAHIRHLEELVAYRERLVEERDAQLAAASASVADALGERDTAREECEREAAARTGEAAARAAEAASARQAIGALEAEAQRLERAVTAQERIIAYRQSVRWWLALPWLRCKLLWQRLQR